MIENRFSYPTINLKRGLKISMVLATFWSATQDAVSQESSTSDNTNAHEIRKQFDSEIKPLIKNHCIRCHNVDEAESGIRVDHLDGTLKDRDIFLWEEIRKQIAEEVMPPENEKQLSKNQRETLIRWIENAIVSVKSQPQKKNGSVRRLTVAQYHNTLNDLLGIKENLTDILPPDAVSKDGFLNNQTSMQLSPLLVETYFEIAEKALDRCIVDEASKPAIQTFRMKLGKSINKNPYPGQLILGANSSLLTNDDFIVAEPTPEKSFEFDHKQIQTKHRFIEGYQGNATVRGWREFDSIYHSIFACIRGTRGYPIGLPNESAPNGLLLRPAIPNPELFGVSGTYGPNANFKVSLRELPTNGNFRVKVVAAKYDDGLLLNRNTKPQTETAATTFYLPDGKSAKATIRKTGIYQIDIYTSDSRAIAHSRQSRELG